MKLSRKKHAELFLNMDSEGFGYYMLHYGPDIQAICKLGFLKDDVENAIKLFIRIEEAICEGEKYVDVNKG